MNGNESLDQQFLTVFDDAKYAKLALENRDKYQKAQPYSHIFFDNFLPESVANAIAAEYPSIEDMNRYWKFHDNQNVRRYFLENSTQFSHRMRLFASSIQSRSFLLFLETLTGIDALLPDPYFMGGGAMVTGKGGFLNVHVDFNWHQKLQSWRRVNALFYLTPDWQQAWGGNLEIWSRDGKQKSHEIPALFNRMVVFSTTSESYHGQPAPICGPDDKYRRVFSAFYYASTKSDKIDDSPHFTRYNENNNDIKAEFTDSPYARGIKQDYINLGLGIKNGDESKGGMM